MDFIWFLLGYGLGRSAMRGVYWVPTPAERRRAEKEARRQRVWDAWESRHPGLAVARYGMILVGILAVVWGGYEIHRRNEPSEPALSFRPPFSLETHEPLRLP